MDDRIEPSTIGAVIVSFYRSTDFVKLKAITVHKTLNEIVQCTKAADLERNAKQALVNLLRSESEQPRPTFDPRLDNFGEK
jgi:hypothetical protein